MTTGRNILLGAGGAIAAFAAAAGLAFAMPDTGHRAARGDLNGDGQITAAEIDQAARQRFTAFDVNGDASLDGAELELMNDRRGRRGGGRPGPDLPGLSAPPAAEPAQPGTATGQPARIRFDFDGNGSVSFEEYRRGIGTRYMLIDTSRDGNVSAAELKAAPRGRGRRD